MADVGVYPVGLDLLPDKVQEALAELHVAIINETDYHLVHVALGRTSLPTMVVAAPLNG